ncbi:hypothetical protein D9756_003487 [Leucocoprinus leucothites]|uniref:Uncharacterized protein n=1 Tax=Leucocoprinus leucothites TaxID=201217 RepID=A0A8H5G686_9AGAR|nr:hypothetical protein D9756_003487 [Leucoagaricus leucothites]
MPAWFELGKSARITTLKPPMLTGIQLLIVPPAVSFIILLIFLILFNTSKDMISTFKPDVSGAFCHSDSGIPGWIAVGVSIPGLSVWFYVYLRTALLFKRKREAISTYDKTLRGRIMSVFVRTSLMTVLTCFGVAFSVYVAAIPSHEELPFSVFQYLALPLSVLLMFGTQAVEWFNLRIVNLLIHMPFQEFFRCWSCKRSTNSLPPDKTGHYIFNWTCQNETFDDPDRKGAACLDPSATGFTT